jgi:hypothetical protein
MPCNVTGRPWDLQELLEAELNHEAKTAMVRNQLGAHRHYRRRNCFSGMGQDLRYRVGVSRSLGPDLLLGAIPMAAVEDKSGTKFLTAF